MPFEVRTATVGAYHWVQGGRAAVQKIMKKGSIIPAAERIDSGTMAMACQLWFGSPDMPPNGDQALLEVVNEALRTLKPPAKKIKKTMFECPDLIAGDLQLLFFGIGDWPWRLIEDAMPAVHDLPRTERDRIMKNGFVFDAERLVEIGGGIRFGDYIDPYQQALRNIIYSQDQSVEEIKRNIKDALASVQEDELREEEAIDFLHRGAFVWENELVVPGRLPVHAALEIWQEGQLL